MHFIRPLGEKKITIQTYEPLEDSKEPVKITSLPVENEPAIQLVPQPVRIGKQVRIPKRVLTTAKATRKET